ncbi:molybdopterin-dependent oxidoreductase [Niallia sp. Krafla_26]|uniref:molybdopterin-dependent oxidoreductase n=1 Tax=Niallia sp. Krafla_26 TaxID=3064703 RepID=UPI003D1765F4
MDQNYDVTRHVCPRNCYSSCSILGYSKNGHLEKVTGDPAHGYTKGLLCAKGYHYINQVYHPDRLKYPMRQVPRGSGNWQRILWSEAIDTITGKIIELYDRYGSHLSLALNKYSGNMGVLHHAMEGFFNGLGKTSRAVGNPCWAPGMDALYYDYGGYQTSDMEDILHAETIILWGVNPVWTSIHSMNYIYEAQKRGAKVITIDPVYTETAKKSDVYLQVKPGSDGTLAVAIAKYIIDYEWDDVEFLKKYSNGWEELKEHLQGLSMEAALAECGQSIEAIQFMAERLSKHQPVTMWIGFGMQRNKNGGQNIRAINALAALTGNIGKKGSGVQFGQRETDQFTYQILNHTPLLAPEQTGFRSVDINDFAVDVQAQQDPPIKFLWITCRNLLTQSSNIEALKQALSSMELIVTVEHFLTETVQYSDIVLPATMLFEEWEIVTSYWHHWISVNQPAVQPYYESKSDLEIARLLSRTLNEKRRGFSGFPTDLTDEEFIDQEFTEEFYQQLHISNWRELLNGPKRMDIPKTAWENLTFPTRSGKIELYSSEAEQNQLSPFGLDLKSTKTSSRHPYILLLNHEPFRINSQFQNLLSFKDIYQEPCIYLHPNLAKEKAIQNDTIVRIFNENGEITIRAKFLQDVHPHTLLVYPNHPLINRLIHFIPADMGKLKTGGKGNAINSIGVNIEKLR